MIISGALLAAGESRRMGQNKLLLPYGNHTVIEECAFQLNDSDVDEVVIITGFQRHKIKDKIENRFKRGIKIIHNADYRSGRASSIRCAVKNLKKSSDAVLFMVADKPTVKSDLINRAITEFKKDSPFLLYVRTPAGRGHPVIFSRKIFGDLLELKGNPAGDTIFVKYEDCSSIIDDDTDQIDIDTPEDYKKVLQAAVK